MKNVPQLRFKAFSGEWKSKKVSEILEPVSDKVNVEKDKFYSQIGIRSHGKGIFYKDPVLGLALGNKRVFWIKENVFIVNIVFAWEQAIAITTSKEIGMIASHRFPMYKPVNQLCRVDYIVYFFLTQKGKLLLEFASPGGAGRNKTLGQNEFKKLAFPIPSLEEQTKIAKFLTAIDDKILQLSHKVELLKQYKKGMMQQIFSQQLRFKDDDGNDFPEWKQVYLSELGHFKNGVNKSQQDFGFGFPFINLMDVFGKLSIQKQQFSLVNVSDKELKLYNLQKGDVLFIRSSVKPEGVGETAVILEDLENTVYSGFLIRFREHKNKLNLLFKKYCFSYRSFRNQILSLSTTSANTNINQNSLNQLTIKLPSLLEQTKIANFLSAIDDKIERTQKQLDNMKQYKKGLLQKMFV